MEAATKEAHPGYRGVEGHGLREAPVERWLRMHTRNERCHLQNYPGQPQEGGGAGGEQVFTCFELHITEYVFADSKDGLQSNFLIYFKGNSDSGVIQTLAIIYSPPSPFHPTPHTYPFNISLLSAHSQQSMWDNVPPETYTCL